MSVSADSAPVIAVERNSRVSISGNGVLRGDTITVSGEGTGTATLYVQTTGWIHDAAGNSSLQLRAISSTRTQIVDQRVDFTATQTSNGR
jgi:hypothetical protein